VANDDVTLSREEAAFTAETLKQVRNTIHKVNPSISKKVDQSLKSYENALLKLSKEETKDPSLEPDEPNSKEWEPETVDAAQEPEGENQESKD